MSRKLDILERLTSSQQEAGSRLRVRSALNPILFACGLVTLPGIVAVSNTSGWAQVALIAVAAAPVALLIIGFVFFMIHDPDKLQSEEYQLQMRALQIIEEKGGTIQVAPASLQQITNPHGRLSTEEERAE